MFEKILCGILAFFSIISIVYCSSHAEVYTDLGYAARSNYIDVYFTKAKALNGAKVKLTSNHKNIQLEDISLLYGGDYEVIQYELFNNSFSQDVDVDILINGVSSYEDEYFTITTSSIKKLSSGKKAKGEIRITLKKNTIKSVSLPFSIELRPTKI